MYIVYTIHTLCLCSMYRGVISRCAWCARAHLDFEGNSRAKLGLDYKLDFINTINFALRPGPPRKNGKVTPLKVVQCDSWYSIWMLNGTYKAQQAKTTSLVFVQVVILCILLLGFTIEFRLAEYPSINYRAPSRPSKGKNGSSTEYRVLGSVLVHHYLPLHYWRLKKL